MKTDEKVVARLDELLELGQKVLDTHYKPFSNVMTDDYVNGELAHQWVTSSMSLLGRVFGADSDHYIYFCKTTKGHVTYSPVFKAMGVLRAAKDDYEHGHLFKVRSLIEAEVFDDFLEQAEHLLAQGYFQAAAVVAGCVLEDGLRKACVAQGVELPEKPKLDVMNAELAKKGLYSKLVQKRITALADLRNSAAHGKWDAFTREDVEEMLPSIRRLMVETLA